jgi:hypothetical protein
MSDTDIYKKRESMPYGSGKAPEKKSRRRRSSSKRAFDDKERKRRSNNKGLRRFIHLAKKKEHERYFWIVLGVFIVVMILGVSIWQFGIREAKVRAEEAEYERSLKIERIPEADAQESDRRTSHH